MPKINWSLLWEATKLPLRVFVLGILPVAITYFTELGTEWAIIIVTPLVILDRYLHLIWKQEEEKDLLRENTKPTGIVPF
jgi:hypothetical protein